MSYARFSSLSGLITRGACKWPEIQHLEMNQQEKSNQIKSLYLSVNVFSTAVLMEDTVNSETNILNQTETC